MVVLGKTKKGYICEVNHSEIEDFLDVYYPDMKKLEVGDEVDLGKGHDWFSQTNVALRETQNFFKAHSHNIEAICKAFATRGDELDNITIPIKEGSVAEGEGLPTHKCNFKDYGFETPDFDGGIVGEIGGSPDDDYQNAYYVGYYTCGFKALTYPQRMPCFWNKETGACCLGAGITDSRYSLKKLEVYTSVSEDTVFNYPITCKIVGSNAMVQFTGLTEGVVVSGDSSWYPNGYTSKYWSPHTDKLVWERASINQEPL